MTYINEFVSDEDIEKYQLLNVKRKYLQKPSWNPNLGNRFNWAIDHSSESYLMLLKTFSEIGPSGREQYVTEYQFLFYLNKRYYVFNIKKMPIPSDQRINNPFKIIWGDFKLINPPNSKCENEIPFIKKALISYGDHGAYSSPRNTYIAFDF